MKRFLIFCSLLILYSTGSFATIRRVGFNGTQIAGVDYKTIILAQTASVAGDTIQIYGQIQLGTLVTINKPLIIIGFGYNFDANANLQAVGTDAPSAFSGGGLIFDLGSENSVIEGCSFTYGANSLDVATSNITVRRCFLPYYGVRLRNDIRQMNNIFIEDCVASVGMFSSTSGNTCGNIQIRNSILELVTFYSSGSSGLIENCVTSNLRGGNNPNLNLNDAQFVVRNCIIYNYNPQDINTIWENNFFSTSQPMNLPAGSNNRWSQSWASLFERLGGTDDNPGLNSTSSFAENYYILKNNSPALNGGFDSNNNPTDCGIFGGESIYRYRLGGVPNIPSIYKLSAPSSSASTNPYNITVSVRSNN